MNIWPVWPRLPEAPLEAVWEPGAGDEAGQQPEALVPGEGGDGRHQQHQGERGVCQGGDHGEERLQLLGQADNNSYYVVMLRIVKLTAFEGKEC